jgi:hypothetical protein
MSPHTPGLPQTIPVCYYELNDGRPGDKI